MATLTGKLYSEAEKEPIWLANIAVTDSKGNQIKPFKGTASEQDGTFRLENLLSTDFVTISHLTVPKETIRIASLPVNGKGEYVFNRNYKSQTYQGPTVTITAPRIPKQSNGGSDGVVGYKPESSTNKLSKRSVLAIGIGSVLAIGITVYLVLR